MELTFEQDVQFTWIRREFKPETWSDETRQKFMVPFQISDCCSCGSMFKVKEGYYRDPFSKCVGTYKISEKPIPYCMDCDGTNYCPSPDPF